MSISINGGHGLGATQPIKTRKGIPSLPMNRHFTVHGLGGGLILATRMGARKPSWACIDQDLRELGFNMLDIELGYSLASAASYGGRSCYGYMWSSRPGQHPVVVTRLSNVPPDPAGRCVRDLAHVESDDRALRDLGCFFSPRRVFTARDAWGHLHGASVRIWGPSSRMAHGRGRLHAGLHAGGICRGRLGCVCRAACLRRGRLAGALDVCGKPWRR